MGQKRPMNWLPKLVVLIVLLTGQAINSLGQISDNSVPESFLNATKSSEIIPSQLLDSVNVAARINEDEQKGIPNRFGIIQQLHVDIKEDGVKTTSGDVNIWRYEINSPDAFSLGITFETYDLPSGAGVYIYSADKQKVRGAYTSENNKSNGVLALAQFPGNSIIIEYNEPTDAAYEGELVIGSVSSAYLNLKSAANEWVQINCDEGQDWQTEKHAVCLITFQEYPYTYYCSGSLVNNVRQDGTPYFLTANHCLSSNSVAQTLVAYFNYENSTCDGNDASLDESVSGAELVATNDYSDFTLLKFDEDPPEEYEPYFAGWNASDDAPSTGTSIHHPEASYKCIALDYDAPVNYRYTILWDDDNRTMPSTHWEVGYDVGTDESGSSGCPLFDQDKRVIGQLHGGDDTNSFFGKLSVSWDYSSTTSKQLKAWLDPDDTGTLRLDGTDYNAPPSADFSADVSIACLNTTVYFTDESKMSPTEWLWQFEPSTVEFVNGTDNNSQDPEVVFSAEGAYTVTLIAGNENGYDTITYENLIEAVANLDVSFIDYSEETSLCGSEIDNFVFQADGANEYTFEVSEEDYFDIETSSDSLILTLKDEALSNGSFDTYIKVTGSHGSCSDSDSVLVHIVMPENDFIENAIALDLGSNEYYSNECGTAEDNEPYPSTSGCLLEDSWCPASGTDVIDNSIWFTFRGPSSGVVTIETEGFDTQIAVYAADSYSDVLNDNYELIGAADNSSSGDEAVLENLKVTPFQTYWLQVDGNDGDYGDLSINLISNSIEVYPNPSTGIFNVTLASEAEGAVQLDVFSLSGRRIYTGTREISYDSNTVSLSLEGEPAGMYFLRMISNGVTVTRKLVLVH